VPLRIRRQPSEPAAALFGSLRVEIGKRWWVTLGLRLSDERSKVDLNSDPAEQFHLRFRYNNILTPFAAAQFALNETYSLYASYADIYLANSGTADGSGRLLSPSHGITIEAGLKGAWRDGALNGSIALYSVREKGIGVFDFNTFASGTVANVYCCYTSSGKNTSKGLDLELAGKLRPNWSIGAGYTANTVSQGNSAYEINEPLAGLTPHHLLKLWTSVRLPGAWSRWSLGGSLRAQSSIYYSALVCPGTPDPDGNYYSSSCSYETEGQKSYAVVSPRIDFQLHPQWRLGFTVSNALDRRYFQTVGASGNFYGEPRSFLVRLDGRF
jgi:outer-membrane receptor for ferric coprogen and ferric-rhodotorulic acid